MSKQTTYYTCQNCGVQYSSWMGKCSNCNEWNTIIEVLKEQVSPSSNSSRIPLVLESLSNVTKEQIERITTGFGELDLILGGGIVKGSLNLLSGEPGVGKSTVLLQLARNILKNYKEAKILYVSGEESTAQIKIRATRIEGNIHLDSVYNSLMVAAESNLEKICYSIEQEKPFLVIIDSIQTIYSENLNSFPGGVSQVRHCTNAIMRLIKRLQIPTFLVGQVTKEGVVAGPKVLEHLVDVVLQFEGTENQDYRMLRALKNRFGSIDEVGFFKMEALGLHEVKNPSAIFIDNHQNNVSGSVKSVFLEGRRALLAEIQALVVPNYAPPLRRTSTGIDYNRLLLLIAVLERRLGLRLQDKDVYIKVSGGLKLNDPAIDLAICVAILSAYYNQVIDKNAVFVGEIGLLGEVRAVRQLEKRQKEAQKQGFDIFYGSFDYNTLFDVRKKLQLQ